MKLIFALLAAVCSLNQAFAFNLNDLKTLVEANKAYTVDQVIPLLPEHMRKNPLLVYDSHALRLDRVSLETPRIILFNEDASLIMAITKYPGQETIAAGEDSIEVIELSSQTHKFEMKDLVFDGTQSPFARSIETNPALCLTCHGANPRPVFNDYNSWPGFFGSFSTRGYAIKGTTEYAALQKFMNGLPQLPRYRDLDFGGYAEDQIGIRTTSRGMGELADQLKFSINLIFGAKLEGQMWRRLGAKLVADPNFRAIAPLFYMMGEESNRCGTARVRVRSVRDMLLTNSTQPERQTALIDRFKAQIQLDHEPVSETLLKFNSLDGKTMDASADPRGVLNIPYANYNTSLREHAPVDAEAFFALMVNMETIFQHLGYDTTDLSTTPKHPTSGIFHLKKVGKLLIDEQFFQNLIGGIYEADPTFKLTYDGMGCELIEAFSQKAVSLLTLPDPSRPGVLYK